MMLIALVQLESLKKIGGAAAAGTQNEGAAVVGSNPVKKKKVTAFAFLLLWYSHLI